MFGCTPCGYDPRVSNTMMGIQMGLAGTRGLLNIFEAKNDGVDNFRAIAGGLGNAASGIGGALMGGAFDRATSSYLGTTMSAVMPTLIGNPYMGGLFASSLMMSPMLFGNPYMGCMPPMSFSSHYMYGMPRFGGFCCHC